jgi:hypothetical protein
MNRRDLFFLLNGATISGSLPTGAQQKTTPAVVVVSEEEVARLIAQRHSIVDDILDEAPWPDDAIDAVNVRSHDPGRDIVV